MKAALVHEVGALPEVGVVAEPAGETIEVLAAPINPIDLAVSRGVLATGHPELPYVPGCEAVGRTADGGLVWMFGGSLGRTSQGAIAERAPVGDAYTVDVPEGADAALAAGLGIAGLAGWLPFAWRAPLTGGEAVLILGATGSVGLVAVQAAKLLGAARVVAAGRSAAGLERAAELGADATLSLDEAGDLEAAFKEAFGGDGPSYVFDPLWGEPAAAAIRAAVPRATIVNLGQSAGATAELASAAVRFKSLAILGHTNFAVPPGELAEHYRRLVGHAIAGEIRLDVERVPLDSVADAWRRQGDGAGVKLVVVPRRRAVSGSAVRGTFRGCVGSTGCSACLRGGSVAVTSRAARRSSAEIPRDGDYCVDIGKLASEHPGGLDRLAVTNQERGANRDVVHAEWFECDVERADRLPVPVREKRDVDAERLCPRTVRPGRVARDRERPDLAGREVVAPVTQEHELVRSGGRPVVEVKTHQAAPSAENLLQWTRLLADRRPNLNVGHGRAGF